MRSWPNKRAPASLPKEDLAAKLDGAPLPKQRRQIRPVARAGREDQHVRDIARGRSRETLLLLDLEASGLDPAKDCPVEAAWAVYSLEHRAVMRAHSTLVDATTYRGDAADAVRDLSDLQDHARDVADGPALGRGGEGGQGERRERRRHRGAQRLIRQSVVPRRGNPSEAVDLHSPRRGWPEWGRRSAWATSRSSTGWRWSRRTGLCRMCSRWRGCFMRWRGLATTCPRCSRGLRPTSLYAVAETDFNAERNALAKEHGFAWVGERKAWERTMADEDAAGLPFRVRKVA